AARVAALISQERLDAQQRAPEPRGARAAPREQTRLASRGRLAAPPRDADPRGGRAAPREQPRLVEGAAGRPAPGRGPPGRPRCSARAAALGRGGGWPRRRGTRIPGAAALLRESSRAWSRGRLAAPPRAPEPRGARAAPREQTRLRRGGGWPRRRGPQIPG